MLFLQRRKKVTVCGREITSGVGAEGGEWGKGGKDSELSWIFAS